MTISKLKNIFFQQSSKLVGYGFSKRLYHNINENNNDDDNNDNDNDNSNNNNDENNNDSNNN